jgi:hypothetical protein
VVDYGVGIVALDAHLEPALALPCYINCLLFVAVSCIAPYFSNFSSKENFFGFALAFFFVFAFLAYQGFLAF